MSTGTQVNGDTLTALTGDIHFEKIPSSSFPSNCQWTYHFTVKHKASVCKESLTSTIATFTGKTVEQCNQACTDDTTKTCVEFAFSATGGSCILYNKLCTPETDTKGHSLYTAPKKVYPVDTKATCTHQHSYSHQSTVTTQCPKLLNEKDCAASTGCSWNADTCGKEKITKK